MAGTEYYVKLFISMKDQTSVPAGKASRGLEGIAKAAKLVASGFVAMRMAQTAVSFVKFGADVGRAETSLESLASSAGYSGTAIIKSIQTASDFTIDRMTAMEVANKAMLLGVAESPEEFADLAKYAVKLGRAMGKDAASSIDDFVVAAGRKSKMIADNLGLMIDNNVVQERANVLMAADATLTEDAATKKAYLAEMLDQAREKSSRLGDSTGDLAVNMEQLDAAIKDAKADWAVIAGNYVSGGEGADGLATKIRGLATTWEQASLIGRAASAGISEMFTGAFDPDTTGIERFAQGWKNAWEDFLGGAEEAKPVITGYTGYVVDATTAIDGQSTALEENAAALEIAQAAAEKATLKQTDLAGAFMKASEADIAKRAIGELGTLLDEDKITVEQYKTAVTETQLAFGLADEASIKLSESVLDLIVRFGEGKVMASDFDAELWTMIDVMNQTREAAEKLDAALMKLGPGATEAEIEARQVEVTRHRSQTGATGAMEGWGLGQAKGTYARRQHGGLSSGMTWVGEGGPEMVQTPPGSRVFNRQQSTNIANHYNMTVNTQANSPSVQQDYRMMQARIGA